MESGTAPDASILRRMECMNPGLLRPLLIALVVVSATIAGESRAQSVVEISGTITSSTLVSLINAKPAGAVTVRPVSGQTATVTGGFNMPRPSVTVTNVTFTDGVTFGPGDNSCQLLNSKAKALYIFGADDVTIRGNYFDGMGQVTQNLIWDEPAGSIPERFVIENNTFTRYYGSSTDHSEALYIGYSADGTVRGNVFQDNGSTAHVFFTWWGNTASPSTSYPRRICVRDNTWGPTHTAYFDINFREEIPTSSGISIDPAQNASTTNAGFTRTCGDAALTPPVLISP